MRTPNSLGSARTYLALQVNNIFGAELVYLLQLVFQRPRMHDESESIPQGMRVDVKCNRLSFSSQRRNVLRKRLNNLPFVRLSLIHI